MSMTRLQFGQPAPDDTQAAGEAGQDEMDRWAPRNGAEATEGGQDGPDEAWDSLAGGGHGRLHAHAGQGVVVDRTPQRPCAGRNRGARGGWIGGSHQPPPSLNPFEQRMDVFGRFPPV